MIFSNIPYFSRMFNIIYTEIIIIEANTKVYKDCVIIA